MHSVANKTDQINISLTENTDKMLEIRTIHATIFREMAERPATFLELLSVTRASHSELTAALEALIEEGSIGKTSDGFQTVYFLPKTRTR